MTPHPPKTLPLNQIWLFCRIEIRTLLSGEVIMTEDSHSDAGLIFIISGSLIMSQKNNDQYEANASDSRLYTAFAVRKKIALKTVS